MLEDEELADRRPKLVHHLLWEAICLRKPRPKKWFSKGSRVEEKRRWDVRVVEAEKLGVFRAENSFNSKGRVSEPREAKPSVKKGGWFNFLVGLVQNPHFADSTRVVEGMHKSPCLVGNFFDHFLTWRLLCPHPGQAFLQSSPLHLFANLTKPFQMLHLHHVKNIFSEGSIKKFLRLARQKSSWRETARNFLQLSAFALFHQKLSLPWRFCSSSLLQSCSSPF